MCLHKYKYLYMYLIGPMPAIGHLIWSNILCIWLESIHWSNQTFSQIKLNIQCQIIVISSSCKDIHSPHSEALCIKIYCMYKFTVCILWTLDYVQLYVFIWIASLIILFQQTNTKETGAASLTTVNNEGNTITCSSIGLSVTGTYITIFLWKIWTRSEWSYTNLSVLLSNAACYHMYDLGCRSIYSKIYSSVYTVYIMNLLAAFISGLGLSEFVFCVS